MDILDCNFVFSAIFNIFHKFANFHQYIQEILAHKQSFFVARVVAPFLYMVFSVITGF